MADRHNNSKLAETFMSAFEQTIYEGSHSWDINLATHNVDGMWIYSSLITETMFQVYMKGSQDGIADCVAIENDRSMLLTEMYNSSVEYTNNLIDKFNKVVEPVDL